MSKFMKSCKKYYGTKDIYEILGVKKTANEKEIKRAYYRVSLKVHPDRVSEDEKDEANIKFQILGKVYGVLSDKDKRAVYDEDKIILDDDMDSCLSEDKDWVDYWRNIFTPITIKQIEEYKEKYRGSEEETKDILSFYEEYQGDMDKIMESVPCADYEDEGYVKKVIEDAIKEDKVEAFKAFTNESKAKKDKRKRKAKKEAEEADEARMELGLDANDSLASAILKNNARRQAESENFLDSLMAKYATKESGKKKKK